MKAFLPSLEEVFLVPSCELCGRNMKGRGRDVTIEGASMIVCPQCATRFGGQSERTSSRKTPHAPSRPSWTSPPERDTSPRPSISPQSARIGRKQKSRSRGPATLDDMMLIENYAEVIRTARQRLKLSQEELAQKVGERISTLQSIEAGRLKPTKKTIRGLERELDISLLETIGTAPIRAQQPGSSDRSATLGDIVKIKRKKSQKSE
jgi:putative transcription factor